MPTESSDGDTRTDEGGGDEVRLLSRLKGSSCSSSKQKGRDNLYIATLVPDDPRDEGEKRTRPPTCAG